LVVVQFVEEIGFNDVIFDSSVEVDSSKNGLGAWLNDEELESEPPPPPPQAHATVKMMISVTIRSMALNNVEKFSCVDLIL
jgi:hypothetical protein